MLFSKHPAMLLAMSILCLALRADSSKIHSKLLDDILSSYDKRVKPDSSDNKTLEVNFHSSLEQIIDVDEKDQVINTIIWNGVLWMDKRLKWDPDSYDGITEVVLEADSIWLPHILLHNTVDVVLSIRGWHTINVKVFYTGLVRWQYIMNSKSSCSMNLRFYPFDVQNCSLEFHLMKYWADEVNFTINKDENGKEDYIENSGYSLLSRSTSRLVQEPVPDRNLAVIYYHIRFQRRFKSDVMNMILPCCLVSVVAMLSFYIPSDSGEKTGIGVTVLLSMTVFLLILRDQMPPTSDFPLIGFYYFGVILMITLSTSLSVFVLTIHHRAAIYDQNVPVWVRRLCFQQLAKLLCLNFGDEDLNQTPNKEQKRESCVSAVDDSQRIKRNKVCQIVREVTAEVNQEKRKPYDNVKQLKLDTLQDILKAIRRHERRVQQEERLTDITIQWKRVAYVVDRLLLILFIFVTLVFTTVILLVASLNGVNE